jgi:excisionase family DNA binding protein
MASHNNTTMLNIEQVARILNVHINTLRRWSNQGFLKTYRVGPRGDRRYKYDDVTHFLKNREQTKIQRNEEH